MAENFIELNYRTNESIRANDVADSISAVSRRYKSFLHQKSEFLGHFEEELHLSGVRQGSQIYEFVPVVIQSALPFIADANAVIQFQLHLTQILDYFGNKKSPPQKITPKVCDDVIKIMNPIQHAGGGINIGAINGPVTINNYHITGQEAHNIAGAALSKKLTLEMPDIRVVKNVKLKFVQSRTSAAKTVGFNSPDKGIISSLDSKVYSILFAEEIEDLKYEIITGVENPFAKEYIVDVEVIEVMSKIKAYRLLSLREA